MEYRHTQYSSIILISAIIILYWTCRYVSILNLSLIIPTVLLSIFACFFLLFSLTVEIKNGFVQCIFGHGLIRKRIKLTEIRQVHPVKNPWYEGWGIHWVPGKYVVWNVSGFDAVEIQLSTLRRVRIGTNEPEKLTQAILLNM